MSDTTPAAPESSTLDTGDGYTIQSTDKSAAQIRETLDRSPQPKVKIAPIPDKPTQAKEPPDASAAAAVLGKKGGEAAAKARKAKAATDDSDGISGGVEESLQESGAEREPAERVVDGAEVEEPEETRGIRSDSIKQRIRESTARAAEAKREAAYWRAEAERVQRERAQAQPPQQQPEAQAPGKRALPFKPEEFETYEDYLDARDDYRRQEWEHEQQANARVDAYAQQLDGYFSGYRERMQKAFNGDLESRVSEEVRSLRVSAALGANEQIGPDNIIADEIVCCENPAGVSLYLSDHPEELQRLMTLPSPQHIAREIMRIEAKAEGVTAGTPPAPRPLSQAKPPVRPVTASPPVSELTGEESYDEHVAKMNARERRQRR